MRASRRAFLRTMVGALPAALISPEFFDMLDRMAPRPTMVRGFGTRIMLNSWKEVTFMLDEHHEDDHVRAALAALGHALPHGFMAVDTGGGVVTSTDGVLWTQRGAMAPVADLDNTVRRTEHYNAEQRAMVVTLDAIGPDPHNLVTELVT